METIDRTVVARHEQLVQYFSEKSMDEHLCMGDLLFAAILFHLPIIVAH